MMLERGEKSLNSWQENISGTRQELIYTQMWSTSFLIIYLESGLISMCVCVRMYVNTHSRDKSSNGLFMCWNAGQLGIVGFDWKDSQYINASLFLPFIRMFYNPND